VQESNIKLKEIKQNRIYLKTLTLNLEAAAAFTLRAASSFLLR
jgi:hypothetical protein